MAPLAWSQREVEGEAAGSFAAAGADPAADPGQLRAVDGAGVPPDPCGRKTRARFLEFCRYLRSLYPASVRIAIICDNFSPHLTTRKDARVGAWAAANNVEIAYTPTNASWLNRIPVNRPSARRHARAV